MNWSLINQPLGTYAYGNTKKEMPLPLAIPLAMAVASTVSSLWGAKKSADASKKAARQVAEEKSGLEAERRLKKNQAWTDTASGQNTMRIMQEQSDRAVQQQKGAAAVGGATDASVAREKELQNEKRAEVIAAANANFEDKKEAIDAGYRQQIAGLNQQQIAAEQQKAQSTAQAAGAAGSALMQGAMMTFGGTKVGQQMLSPGQGSPGGGGVAAPTDLQGYAARLQAESSIDAMRRNAQMFRMTQLNQMGW